MEDEKWMEDQTDRIAQHAAECGERVFRQSLIVSDDGGYRYAHMLLKKLHAAGFTACYTPSAMFVDEDGFVSSNFGEVVAMRIGRPAEAV
jgi:hypothetical protein